MFWRRRQLGRPQKLKPSDAMGSNPIDATEQNERAKAILQEWIDQQGHERCWYYPDLFNRLIKVYGIETTKEPNLPPRCEFEEGCRRYQEEEYERIDR